MCGYPSYNLFPLKWRIQSGPFWMPATGWTQTEKRNTTRSKRHKLSDPGKEHRKTCLVSDEHLYFPHCREPHPDATPGLCASSQQNLQPLKPRFSPFKNTPLLGLPKKTPYTCLPNKSVFLVSIAENSCSGLSNPRSSSLECYASSLAALETNPSPPPVEL